MSNKDVIQLNDFGFSDVPDNYNPKSEPAPVINSIDSDVVDMLQNIQNTLNELKQKHEVELDDATQAELDRRLQEMANLILPFLQKLLDAQSDTIYWPVEKRREIISAQMEKINSLLP